MRYKRNGRRMIQTEPFSKAFVHETQQIVVTNLIEISQKFATWSLSTRIQDMIRDGMLHSSTQT